MNLTLFPNTFLFSLNVSNPNTPGSCCVLGFHTYFLDVEYDSAAALGEPVCKLDLAWPIRCRVPGRNCPFP